MVPRKLYHRQEAMGGGLSAGARARAIHPMSGVRTKRLEVVLKYDSFGTGEALSSMIGSIKVPRVEINVIHMGVGTVSKSDLLMAMTGSKLVIGFNTGITPKLDQWVKEHGAEVRLYKVIYKLADDLKRIAESLITPEAEEKIIGKAKVIAIFKSTHKGIILGCEVQEGFFAVGKDFRVIAAMGPVYSGRIESLQIEKRIVREAREGQQVGVKISDFNKARLGDLVESFEVAVSRKIFSWQPSGNILHLTS